MPTIRLHTLIKSSPEIVFDLSRDIDFHQKSAVGTKEKAISGRTTGLIELGETVTWQATHFGIKQKLTTEITHFEYPSFFVDEMTKGIFKSFIHKHLFKKIKEGTEMIDIFSYQSPLGIIGKFADILFLKSYLKRFLEIRNQAIKDYAENHSQ